MCERVLMYMYVLCIQVFAEALTDTHVYECVYTY